MKDLKEIKNNVKGNNNKIDDLAEKVMNIENKNKDTEERNANQFKELKEDIGKVEERVTAKLMTEIEPSLVGMKNEIQTSIGTDLRRLVQEEVALQRLKEAKEQEDATNIPE